MQLGVCFGLRVSQPWVSFQSANRNSESRNNIQLRSWKSTRIRSLLLTSGSETVLMLVGASLLPQCFMLCVDCTEELCGLVFVSLQSCAEWGVLLYTSLLIERRDMLASSVSVAL